MLATGLSQRVGPERVTSATLALGALTSCAVVAMVDPERSSLYPVCPTRALLGLDCPACGTLRGLHALGRGHLAEALSHNVLLVVAVPLGLVMWLRWVMGAAGRPTVPLGVPRWVAPTAIIVAAVFAVARNLPVAALAWLGSS